MTEKKGSKIRRETLVEKLLRRSLETVGGSVDSVFGRGKKPDALPATSDLSERLRRMIDAQAQINKDGRKLAPHLISIKYAWGQTSDEFEIALRRLKNELLIVAIDFINDNRFATLAPVKIESKADILTTGFTMSIGFDEASLRESEQVEIPIEIYAKLLPGFQSDAAPPPLEITVNVAARFSDCTTRRAILQFIPEKKATLTVGRIKEIDLYLDDDSVSKRHASLAMSAEGILRVADVGSTNGTFLNGERISYGKAYEIGPETIVGFGDVTVTFEWQIPQPELSPETLESEQLGGNNNSTENIKMPEASEGDEVRIGVRTAPVAAPAVALSLLKDRDDETKAEELPHTIENNDFTQSLETNEVNKNLTDENLLGANSLHGKSGGILPETNSLTTDERQPSSEKPLT